MFDVRDLLSDLDLGFGNLKRHSEITKLQFVLIDSFIISLYQGLLLISLKVFNLETVITYNLMM